MTVDHTIEIANSEGLLTSDRHIRTRMAVTAIASDGSDTQTGSCSPGRGMGLEVFEMFTPEYIGNEAARQAMVNLSAVYCPAGQMPVAIESGFNYYAYFFKKFKVIAGVSPSDFAEQCRADREGN